MSPLLSPHEPPWLRQPREEHFIPTGRQPHDLDGLAVQPGLRGPDFEMLRVGEREEWLAFWKEGDAVIKRAT